MTEDTKSGRPNQQEGPQPVSGYNLPINDAGSFQAMSRELHRLGRIEIRRQKPRMEAVRMKNFNTRYPTEGKLGYILAWLIGIPVPVLILIYLLRGH